MGSRWDFTLRTNWCFSPQKITVGAFLSTAQLRRQLPKQPALCCLLFFLVMS